MGFCCFHVSSLSRAKAWSWEQIACVIGGTSVYTEIMVFYKRTPPTSCSCRGLCAWCTFLSLLSGSTHVSTVALLCTPSLRLSPATQQRKLISVFLRLRSHSVTHPTTKGEGRKVDGLLVYPKCSFLTPTSLLMPHQPTWPSHTASTAWNFWKKSALNKLHPDFESSIQQTSDSRT